MCILTYCSRTGLQDPYTVNLPGNMSTDEKSSDADMVGARACQLLAYQVEPAPGG